jgi:hypothetical protein
MMSVDSRIFNRLLSAWRRAIGVLISPPSAISGAVRLKPTEIARGISSQVDGTALINRAETQPNPPSLGGKQAIVASHAPATSAPNRIEFFQMPKAHDEFEAELTSHLQTTMKNLQSQFIHPKNFERFYHGSSWGNADPADQTDLVSHSHEITIPLKGIVDHDLGLIPRYAADIAQGMFRQFQGHLFGTLEKTTEKTGNVVDVAQIGNLAEAFLEMLRKIEFSVDEHGNISRPSCVASPEQHRKLRSAIRKKGRDFMKTIRETIAEKDYSALEEERNRLSKFADLND